ncbi:lipid A biosynthesis acyltransferase [Planctomycetota bacterium]|nr:lipid A biosynthesis acyltransferase [Planctomycetota bacterium]
MTSESVRSQRSTAWTGRSRGGELLFLVCAALVPRAGIIGVWLGSFVIAAGFLVIGGRKQYGILSYWWRLRPRCSRWTLLVTLWRHYASFGRVLCDRLLFILSPQRYRLESTGIEHAIGLMRQRRGFIFLSAHHGNWEIAPLLIQRGISEAQSQAAARGEPAAIAPPVVHIVMIQGDLPAIQRFSDRHRGNWPVRFHDPRNALGTAVELAAALGRGEIVCLLGDRVHADQPAVAGRFLGRLARFPAGPFQTALLTGAPILPAFMTKTGLGGYRLEVDPPWTVRAASRADRQAAVAAAAQRWARRLELQVRRYPFQWHNFFDFFTPSAESPRR